MRLIVGDDEHTRVYNVLGKPCSHSALGTPELVVLYRWNFCIVGVSSQVIFVRVFCRRAALRGLRAQPAASSSAAIATRTMDEEGMKGSGVPPAEKEFETTESEVERLIRDMEHQIAHLVRSNKELEEFMKEEGQNKELRKAIGENIVSIARRRAMVEDLRQQAGLAPAKAAVLQPAQAVNPLPPPPAPPEGATTPGLGLSGPTSTDDAGPMDTSAAAEDQGVYL
jgi:TolA-binding protein